MKTRQTIIATSIAALLVSGSVFAKELHEDKWNNVKSYGNVLLSDDSVDNWGPWSDFVEPAAGAPSPVQMPGSSGSDPYKKTPDVLTQGCAAGDWCGYAVFKDANSDSSYHDYGRSNYSKKPLSAGLFTLTLTPEDSTVTAGSGKGSGTAFWRLTSIDTSVIPNFSDSGTNIPVYFGGERDNGLHHFHTEYVEKMMLAFSGDTATASGFSHNIWSREAQNEVGYGPFELATSAIYLDTEKHRLASNDEVAIGRFSRQVESYTSGEETMLRDSGGWSSTQTDGYYVAGIATPQAYLAGQQAQNIRASYWGGSYDGSKQGVVNINVQFGSGDWQGTWYSTGKGSFGFEAAGKINGANISADSSGLVQQKGATLTGYVQGTFYGQTAGSIGGVSSVTRTPTVQPSVDARVASAMPQTQTAIFLVNKTFSSSNTPSNTPK